MKNKSLNKRRKVLAEQKAAKLRGEQGYNPSGTQGARGTEGKFMNPKIYGEEIQPRKQTRHITDLLARKQFYDPPRYT